MVRVKVEGFIIFDHAETGCKPMVNTKNCNRSPWSWLPYTFHLFEESAEKYRVYSLGCSKWSPSSNLIVPVCTDIVANSYSSLLCYFTVSPLSPSKPYNRWQLWRHRVHVMPPPSAKSTPTWGRTALFSESKPRRLQGLWKRSVNLYFYMLCGSCFRVRFNTFTITKVNMCLVFSNRIKI